MNQQVLNLAIIDDDTNAVNIISGCAKDFFNRNNHPVILKTFTNPKSFLTMDGTSFDLVFADIEMPEMDGISLMGEYKKIHRETDIIFISNREDKIFDSLKVQPFGFIRKKSFFVDVPNILTSYMEELSKRENENRQIVFEEPSGIVTLNIDEIVYVEVERNVQTFHMNGEKVVDTHSTLQKILEMLEPYGFIQIHKSFLVNYRYIKTISNDCIRLYDGSVLTISKRKISEVKDRYLELIQSEIKIHM